MIRETAPKSKSKSKSGFTNASQSVREDESKIEILNLHPGCPRSGRTANTLGTPGDRRYLIPMKPGTEDRMTTVPKLAGFDRRTAHNFDRRPIRRRSVLNAGLLNLEPGSHQ